MFKKIDYYLNGKYYGITNSFRTYKEARTSLLIRLQDRTKFLSYYVLDLIKLLLTAKFSKNG